MRKNTFFALGGLAVAAMLSGCFPTISFENEYPDDPYMMNSDPVSEPQAFSESIVALRNLPYASGDFSDVFSPVGIKKYIDAVQAGEEPNVVFPDDGGCSFGNISEGFGGAVSLDWHLCANDLPYSDTRINGHLSGRYEQTASGDYELTINFDCLNTEAWTLFGTETIKGSWDSNTAARYSVKYDVEISTYTYNNSNYMYFKGNDVQTFDGTQFQIESGDYTIASNQGTSTLKVSQPLSFVPGCVENPAGFTLFSRGIEIESFGDDTAEMNYGSGACDATVTITHQGRAVEHSLTNGAKSGDDT
ncbi:MAG TPA: hypothetical protein DCE41_02055 [Cytophagales bacterium]|nr:hypothetical protein [Cytophagales bacterium]HAA22149.1 hypothetical protein [Cytophagales bacterium]HAP63501.1 hypothetical protein [Cytophagales bacterium]